MGLLSWVNSRTLHTLSSVIAIVVDETTVRQNLALGFGQLTGRQVDQLDGAIRMDDISGDILCV